MKKKILLGIMILCSLLITSNVKAQEIFFTNKNGVGFTKFQYKTAVDSLGLHSVLNMTQEVYDNTYISEWDENTTKVTVLEDHNVEIANGNASILDTRYHETTYKKLTGIASCTSGSDRCSLEIINYWKKNPSVRSYDVIGTLLHGTTFYNDSASAYAQMNGDVTSFVVEKRTSSGRAAAIKLSDSGNIDNIVFHTYVKPDGSAQVSYQHAAKTVTKLSALSFEFSGAGMGGVFGYADRYLGYYDDMAGLSLTVKD